MLVVHKRQLSQSAPTAIIHNILQCYKLREGQKDHDERKLRQPNL
jgi:hypothetical protein